MAADMICASDWSANFGISDGGRVESGGKAGSGGCVDNRGRADAEIVVTNEFSNNCCAFADFLECPVFEDFDMPGVLVSI